MVPTAPLFKSKPAIGPQAAGGRNAPLIVMKGSNSNVGKKGMGRQPVVRFKPMVNNKSFDKNYASSINPKLMH